MLQDTGFKKDGGSGFESGSVPKARRAKNAESNFVSFVTDPDSEMPEKTKLVLSLPLSLSPFLCVILSLSLSGYSF